MMKWIKDQIEWFKSLFSDDTGKASSRRIIELLVAWSFVFSYIKVSMYNQKMEDVPMTWAFLLAGILGLKTVDYYFRNKVDATKNGTGNGNNLPSPPNPPK